MTRGPKGTTSAFRSQIPETPVVYQPGKHPIVRSGVHGPSLHTKTGSVTISKWDNGRLDWSDGMLAQVEAGRIHVAANLIRYRAQRLSKRP